MNKISALTFYFAACLIGAGLVLFFYPANPMKLGNAITQGLVSSVHAETDVSVGPQNALTVATALTSCTSRIVSTGSTSVMLSFSNSVVPTLNQGVWQAASTTKEYDNAQYGCGIIRGIASASSTVHVVTTSQQ